VGMVFIDFVLDCIEFVIGGGMCMGIVLNTSAFDLYRICDW
jgi:hypothetical protein